MTVTSDYYFNNKTVSFNKYNLQMHTYINALTINFHTSSYKYISCALNYSTDKDRKHL